MTTKYLITARAYMETHETERDLTDIIRGTMFRGGIELQDIESIEEIGEGLPYRVHANIALIVPYPYRQGDEDAIMETVLDEIYTVCKGWLKIQHVYEIIPFEEEI